MNPNLAVQVPLLNTVWDRKSFNSGFRMNIIGETPPAYANIDPSNFDNIFTQLDIDKNKV